jgi:hypothetical protein
MSISCNRPKLSSMRNLETAHVDWFEEGGSEVVKVGDLYVVYYVQQYGGHGDYTGTFTNIDEVLNLYYSWT